jgi:hypothetical protein
MTKEPGISNFEGSDNNSHEKVRFCPLLRGELVSTLVLLELNQVNETSSAPYLVELERMLELKSRQNLENYIATCQVESIDC